MRLRFLLVAVTSASVGSPPALACAPMRAGPPFPDPPAFLTGAGTPRGPVHLPANAAGVVYRSSGALEARDFSMTDTAAATSLALRIRRLQAPASVAGMPTLERFDKVRDTLYRIEPRSRFEPGKRYAVRDRRTGIVLDLVIDRATVDMAHSGIRVVARQSAWRETVIWYGDCWSSAEQAVVQETRVAVPAALAPYRERMLEVAVQAPGIGWVVPMERISNWPSDLLQTARGLRDGVRHASVAGLPARPAPAALASMVAFLEVDDAWHPSAPSAVALGRDSAPRLDSLLGLRAAMRSGDSVLIAAQLAATPLRASDVFTDAHGRSVTAADWSHMGSAAIVQSWAAQRHRAALQANVERLMAHREPAVRSAAVLALARVQSVGPRDAPRSQAALARMLAAMQDRHADVRRSAVLALLEVRTSLEDQQFFCPAAQEGAPALPPAPPDCVAPSVLLPLLPSARAFQAHADPAVRSLADGTVRMLDSLSGTDAGHPSIARP